MAASLVQVGPDLPQAVAAVLKSHEAALRELQNPTAPIKLAHVATKSKLTGAYPPADFKLGAVICDEINAVVVSTSVAGTWTWLRADGSAL